MGAALAALEMQGPTLARAVPTAVGAVVLIAGALQFTAWKAHHLACCREAPARQRTGRPRATLAALGLLAFLGLVLALMRLSGKPWLVNPAAAYVNTLRSIPLVMVILWFFLLIPAAIISTVLATPIVRLV